MLSHSPREIEADTCANYAEHERGQQSDPGTKPPTCVTADGGPDEGVSPCHLEAERSGLAGFRGHSGNGVFRQILRIGAAPEFSDERRQQDSRANA